VFNKIKFFLIGFIQGLKSDYWGEVTTQSPPCTYYFGPFQSFQEAKSASTGYIEDLLSEGALGIKVVVKRCRPDVLTIVDEPVS
jgi:hypothetical protein